MSKTNKSIIFLVLTFAISWGVTFGAHYSGLRETLSPVVVLMAMMAGPAIAALICAFAFEKGRRIEALGLKFKPNLWWVWAWLIPLALAALSVAATLLLGGKAYIDPGQAALAAAEAAGQDVSQVPPMLVSTWFLVAVSAVVGALINTPILTFTEELGWRGYLHDLWRPAGFWRASIGTGVIWGFWHLPAIMLYGLNYPSAPLVGVGLFVIWCALLSPIMTLIRDRGGSVWAAGITHGTINAIAGLTILSIQEPNFPWNGFVGIGGFVALALGVLLAAVLNRPALAPKAAEA